MSISETDGDADAANSKDSADIAEILSDSDLSIVRDRIRASREEDPPNPARALRLLDLIGQHRRVEGLIGDAARFDDDRDAAQILGVAALEREVGEAAEILLAKWPSGLADAVVRTFARQRPTRHVAQLIRHLKQQKQDRQQDAAGIINAVLDEFAFGDAGFRDGGHNTPGRPIRDIELVHIHLTAERCGEEANGLLDRVFQDSRRPGFAYDLWREFAHDAPRSDVLTSWALATVRSEGSDTPAVRVVRELLELGGPQAHDVSARGQTDHLIVSVGEYWPSKPLVRLCVHLTQDGYGDTAAAIRRRVARRASLWQVAEMIELWSRTPELADSLESLLDDAVNATSTTLEPRTVAEIDELAEAVTEECKSHTESNQLRRQAALGVNKRDGADIAHLLGSLNDAMRRRVSPQVAKRLALAAKANDVTPTAVANYIRCLRHQNRAGSRQAADYARDALTSVSASEPSVVGQVGVHLAHDAKTKGDALEILKRYLSNHAVASARDVVLVFQIVDQEQMPDDFRSEITDLARTTVGRWPPVRRREAAHELRRAGLTERADQVTPN